MINVADYKEVRYTFFKFVGGTSFHSRPFCKLNYKGFQGRMLVTNREVDAQELKAKLKGTCYKDGLTQGSSNLLGKTIFVSKKSKMSRDVLRQSYKIVLDADKADLIVFPKLKDIYRYTVSLWGIKDEILYTAYLTDIPEYSPRIDYIFEEAVKRFCEKTGLDESEVQHRSDYKLITLRFIHNVPEYREMLEEQYPNRHYIEDTALPFTPLNKITPQTLQIWSRVQEINVLEKLLIGSDWQRYPLTMWCFLRAEHEDFADRCGNQGKVLLEGIQYWTNYLNNVHKLVDADDWNMLQSWILYKLGVEGPAYVSADRVQNLKEYYRKFLKSSFAVMPVNISVPTDLLSIKETVNSAK